MAVDVLAEITNEHIAYKSQASLLEPVCSVILVIIIVCVLVDYHSNSNMHDFIIATVICMTCILASP